MSGKKKILIGVGIVVVLGGVAFANVKFKRNTGIEVTTEAIKKRRLEAIVNASGKIQPKRDVNISADTMGRVTDLAVDEGYRVTKGQFLLQIDPRNLRSAVQRTEASLQAAKSQVEQLKVSIESAKVALKQSEDAYTRQQNLWKGGLTTRELQLFLHGLADLPIVGADVVEVAPAYDHGEITAIAAANAVYELLGLVAVAAN